MGKQIIITDAEFQNPILTGRALTQYLVQGYYSWSPARLNSTSYFVASGDPYDSSGLAKRFICATSDGAHTMIPISWGNFKIKIPSDILVRVSLTTSSQDPMTSGTFISRSNSINAIAGSVINSEDIPSLMTTYGSEANGGDYRKRYNSSYNYVAWGISFSQIAQGGVYPPVFTIADLLKLGVYICK